MLQENNTVKTIALINALVGTGKNGPNESKAPVITDDVAESSVASFSDGADGMALKSCVVSIDPVQSGSGDPAPDNVRPITGHTGTTVTRTGVNLMNPDNWNVNQGVPLTVSGGKITLSNSGYQENNNWYDLINGLTYTLSFHVKTISLNNSSAMFAVYFDGTKTIGQGTNAQGNILLDSVGHEVDVVYTVSGKSKIAFGGWAYQGTVEISNIQLELGSTASPYTPYVGQIYPITFPTAAGTVYGGTVDLEAQTLTVDRAQYIFTGTETWMASSTQNRFYTYISRVLPFPCAIQPMVENAEQNLISSIFGTFVYKNADGVCYVFSNDENMFTLVVNTTAAETVDDVKSLFAGTQLVYEPATPLTYSLTDLPIITTLLGENHIWADTGALSLTYPADTKLYVQKELAISQSLMELIITANHESGMTASKAYSAGDLLVVNGTLYKATTSIANGGTLTVGTNVTATTVANELAALA